MIKINRPQCPNPQALLKDYKHSENKDALRAASFDKCMYCEGKVSHTYYGDIEHIKPKSKYTDLEFTWENLGYVCARCNGIKSDKFDESNPILNPYEDDPETHLMALGAFLGYKNMAVRGQVTIEEERGVGLNRAPLVERRQERINGVQRVLDICAHLPDETYKNAVLEEMEKEGSPDKEFSFCIKELLKTYREAQVSSKDTDTPTVQG